LKESILETNSVILRIVLSFVTFVGHVLSKTLSISLLSSWTAVLVFD